MVELDECESSSSHSLSSFGDIVSMNDEYYVASYNYASDYPGHIAVFYYRTLEDAYKEDTESSSDTR